MGWVFKFDNQATRQVRSVATSWFSVFEKSGDAVDDKLAAGGEVTKSSGELAVENADLKRELAALRIQSQELDRLLRENQRFRELLDFEQSSPLKLIPAKVIGRNVSTWWSTVTINRGLRDGIAVDSPVVTDQGLVGKTAEVEEDVTTVVLMTDERCQLGAKIIGTQERGIIIGSREATKETPDLRLKYLSKDASPQIGAKVYSSNDGGLFPEWILLGEIRSFTALDLSGEALVKPAVDFSDLGFVFVIERNAQSIVGTNACPMNDTANNTNKTTT